MNAELTPQELRTLRRIHAAGGKARQYVSGHAFAGEKKDDAMLPVTLNMRHFEQFKHAGLIRYCGGYMFELTEAGREAVARDQKEAGR